MNSKSPVILTQGAPARWRVVTVAMRCSTRRLAVGHDDLAALDVHLVAGLDGQAFQFDMGVQAFPGVLDLDGAGHVDLLASQSQRFDHCVVLPWSSSCAKTPSLDGPKALSSIVRPVSAVLQQQVAVGHAQQA